MTSSRGPAGYPDYQRVENYDGPPFLSKHAVKLAALTVEEFTKLDVSRYTATALTAEITKGLLQIYITWWANEAETVLLGQKEYLVTATAGEVGVLRITNLGPFMRIQFKAIKEEAVATVSASSTNRQPTQEAIPSSSVLLNSLKAYAANEERTFSLPELVSGPIRVQLDNKASHPCAVFVEAINTIGEQIAIAAAEQLEAGKRFLVLELSAPALPLRFTVVSVGEAQEILTSVLLGA
jgi:hypothetical protein